MTFPAAVDLPVPAPPADVAALIRPHHPRLMVDDAALAGIADRIASHELTAELYDELLGHADALLTLPVSRYEFPNGRTLLVVTREVQRRLYVLAMAYRLSKDERYAGRAAEEMVAVAAFPDWNPESFLSVAELLHAFAVGYDWLHECLDDAQRQVVRHAIVTLGLEPAIAQHESGARWTTSSNNWNVVCNSGTIMAALAVGDEEPELANEAMRRAFGSLPVALAEYGPDGGFPEGVTYWGYATRFLAPTMASLQTAIGDDFGITETPGLDRTVDFGIYMTGPSGQQFNFSDAALSAHPAGTAAHWLAAHYGVPVHAWWAEQGAPRQPRALPPLHLMWQGLVDAVPPSEADLPLDRQFDAVSTFLSRSAWNSPTANFFGFKAGDNASSHGDLDLGTFVIDALGARWATDLGPETYDLPGYWSAGPDGRRWTYYRKRPEGHNTLVINPDATPGQAVDARGTLVATGSSPDASFAVADLTEAYAAQGVTSWRRGVALIDGRSRFVVQDEVTASCPVEAWWFMHTTAEIDLGADGRSAILSLDGRRLRAALIDPPDGARFSVMDAVPLPTSPNPDGQTPNTGVRKLVIAGPRAPQLRLSVLLEPLPAGVPGPEPVVADLADWTVDPLPIPA
ncbi:heparinase II/III family protein [Isoptericola sp. NPDC056578]|uniref:heparinase II/III domain-containing protein n=1 Tax=Isoptericola sp. NPDC056578 TaxID=3345870 RepID=UPI0036C12F1A